MKKNDVFNITATDIANDGNGIGRKDNMVVFCQGLLPGESGKVHIIKAAKSFCIGKTINRFVSSPERVDPPICHNFQRGCGGCAFCHLNYEAQIKYKQKYVIDCLKRIGGLDYIESVTKPIIPSDEIFNYRNKAIYPFSKGISGNTVCGFYASASHRLIPLTDKSECRLENKMSALIRKFTLEFAVQNNISVYDESSGSGILRALMVRTNSAFAPDSDAASAMAVLVINGDMKLPWLNKYADGLFNAFRFIASVYVCLNTGSTNVIMTSDIHLLRGKRFLRDTIGSFTGAPVFDISPLSFFQTNPRQTAKLYDAVYNVLPESLSLIYDIYCGIGTIGIYLLARLKSERNDNLPILAGIEAVSDAVEDAKRNAASNGLSKFCNFFYGDASAVTPSVIERFGKPSVIILDPPRKGCDASLIETVLNTDADSVIYVSCNPATLARDLKLFCAEKYNCISVQPVDMFPHCGHVETVCLLSRHNAERHIDVEIQMNEHDLTTCF